MKKLLICLFLSSSLFAQTKTDSLEKVLLTTPASQRPKTLRELCNAYLSTDIRKGIFYGRKALTEAEKLADEEAIMRCNLALNRAYVFYGNSDSIKYFSQKALPLAIKLKNDSSTSRAYMGLGNAEFYKGNFESALGYYLQGIPPAEKANDLFQAYSLQNNVGTVNMRLGRRSEAEKSFLQVANYFSTHKLPKPSDIVSLGYVYTNLATICYISNRYKEALDYANKAVRIGQQQQNGHLLARSYAEQGNAYQKSDRPDEALAAFLKACRAAREVGDESALIVPSAGAGSIFQVKNQLDSATKYIDQALAVAKKFNDKNYLAEIYQLQVQLVSAKREYKNLNLYEELARTYRDSVNNETIAEKISETQVKYETAKKEKELLEQREQNFRQRTWLITLALSLLALLLLGYLYYSRSRLKQKALLDAAVIREQQLGLNAVIEAQEAERRRIAKDLHDGIAQELVALKLGFNVLQNRLGNVAPAEAQRLEDLSSQLNDSCTEVRNIAHVMMPPTLEQHGLVPSLEMLLRNSLEPVGLQTEFDHFNLPTRLNEKTELGLYRIAQELLNNVLKHAQADKVILQLYQAGNNLIMRIEDNGKSFDFDEAKRRGSMGLLNILSRVSTLSGTYTSEKGEPTGTVATVRIPVD
ncbi:sensor histidine kinase [Spirosoma sp. BT702]|uniref:Sensor histidine kinase n=1 Tax=Spirosoma profusum TaxID=2771354 RepID=A0A927ARH7_9BACT|nr:sensor histidine kinase [Spirosoma profusum]MBD2699780.1 sensor histidine kinase [Spirosoma profusum]